MMSDTFFDGKLLAGHLINVLTRVRNYVNKYYTNIMWYKEDNIVSLIKYVIVSNIWIIKMLCVGGARGASLFYRS